MLKYDKEVLGKRAVEIYLRRAKDALLIPSEPSDIDFVDGKILLSNRDGVLATFEIVGEDNIRFSHFGESD